MLSWSEKMVKSSEEYLVKFIADVDCRLADYKQSEFDMVGKTFNKGELPYTMVDMRNKFKLKEIGAVNSKSFKCKVVHYKLENYKMLKVKLGRVATVHRVGRNVVDCQHFSDLSFKQVSNIAGDSLTPRNSIGSLSVDEVCRNANIINARLYLAGAYNTLKKIVDERFKCDGN